MIMKLKKITKEILIKSLSKNVEYILTHSGFVNNCNLTIDEIDVLNVIIEDMKLNNFSFIIDNNIFSLYTTSYNGGYVVAGIKITKSILL